MAKTRVVLADDHALVRAGLKALICAQADMEVVGEASTAHEALEVATRLRPDVLTLDVTMPGGGSLRTIERVHCASPLTRVVVLTMHADVAYLRAAMAAGAMGYVVKTAADTELLTAIRTVARGRKYVGSDLAEDAARAALMVEPDAATPLATLSAREREVLQLLAQGYTNQQAAEKLYLSVKTVETYRARLMDKLGLRARADLVRLAIEMGLLDPLTEPRTPPDDLANV